MKSFLIGFEGIVQFVINYDELMIEFRLLLNVDFLDITFETITRLLMRLAQQQVAPEFRVFERKYPFTFCLMMVDKGTSND